MNITDFRAAFAKLTSHGWLDLEEALLLVSAAEQTEGTIVEIGSYYGRSAMLLAHLRRKLICIDPWEDTFPAPNATGAQVYAHFIANICSLGISDTVYPLKMRVEDWAPVPAGLVYCDGDHSFQGTLNQIQKALQCNPTIIAAHDVNDSGGGIKVKRACLDLLGPWQERVGRLAIWKIR